MLIIVLAGFSAQADTYNMLDFDAVADAKMLNTIAFFAILKLS
jgi:hypothetical protein